MSKPEFSKNRLKINMANIEHLATQREIRGLELVNIYFSVYHPKISKIIDIFNTLIFVLTLRNSKIFQLTTTSRHINIYFSLYHQKISKIIDILNNILMLVLTLRKSKIFQVITTSRHKKM